MPWQSQRSCYGNKLSNHHIIANIILLQILLHNFPYRADIKIFISSIYRTIYQALQYFCASLVIIIISYAWSSVSSVVSVVPRSPLNAAGILLVPVLPAVAPWWASHMSRAAACYTAAAHASVDSVFFWIMHSFRQFAFWKADAPFSLTAGVELQCVTHPSLFVLRSWMTSQIAWHVEERCAIAFESYWQSLLKFFNVVYIENRMSLWLLGGLFPPHQPTISR